MDCCNDYGMSIKSKKTKFFVINGTKEDKFPLTVASTEIGYSPKYMYLGAWFTDSGIISDIIALHETSN